jgi:hypothetical protein
VTAPAKPRKRRKRGGQRFITFEQIADVVDKRLRTVISDSNPRNGKPAKFDRRDLRSIVRYILRETGGDFTPRCIDP